MMTWNEHVEAHRAALEFMGLRPPPALLAFSFVAAPDVKSWRCKSPPPRPARFDGGVYHSRSIGRRPMPLSERMATQQDVRALRSLGVHMGPPGTYGECPPPGERCGHVSCRHHLGLSVNPESGAVTITHPVPDVSPDRAHLMAKLSPRDLEIKSMIDQGLSNADIGTALGMKESTVKKVKCRTRSKLNVDPELDILAMAETCSLRVADKGKHTLDEVAALMGGLDKTFIHRLEVAALAKLRARIQAEEDGTTEG